MNTMSNPKRNQNCKRRPRRGFKVLNVIMRWTTWPTCRLSTEEVIDYMIKTE